MAGNKEVKRAIIFDADEGFGKSDDLAGVDGEDIIAEYERDYPFKETLAHTLGYLGEVSKEEVGKINPLCPEKGPRKGGSLVGRGGLEEEYECILGGIDGEELIEVNSLGKKVRILGEKPATPGTNIKTSIDLNLQTVVAKTMEEVKGAAVITDKEGSVLALYSAPSFDPNAFIGKVDSEAVSGYLKNANLPLFNRAISAQYPTGSTIKPFEASGALQEKLISPIKLINDPGFIEVKSKYDPSIVYRFGGVTPHGWVDMREAIAVSSNIYFYTIGGGYLDQQGLGPTKIAKYLSLFGWGEKTGIDLPGEFKGFIPSPEWKKEYKKESWWDGDTYNLAIGQSDLQVTPLQLALAYATIANGGTLYKPQIVNKIIDTSTQEPMIVKQFEPEIVRQGFIDKENLKVIQEGMRDGVAKSYGSSYFLNSLPVAVASKTGTAEIGKDGYYNTWASVYGPYENPNIVLIVTIEEVEGLRSGSLTVAKEVLNWYFSQSR